MTFFALFILYNNLNCIYKLKFQEYIMRNYINLLSFNFLLIFLFVSSIPLYAASDSFFSNYPPLAKCNTINVTMGEVFEKIRNWKFENRGIKVEAPRIRLIIEALALEKLLVKFAREEKIDENINFIIERESLLKKMYMTAFISSLDKEIKTKPLEIKSEELKKARYIYEKNIYQYQRPELIGADVILTKKKGDCIKARKELVKGDLFNDVVKNYSIHSSASRKGYIGYLRKGFSWPDRVIEALKKLKQNDITEVIETPKGWAVFRKRDVRPSIKLSFDDVKNQIVLMIREKEMPLKMRYMRELSFNLKRLVREMSFDRKALSEIFFPSDQKDKFSSLKLPDAKADRVILKSDGISYSARDLVNTLNAMGSGERARIMSSPSRLIDFVISIRNEELFFKKAVDKGLKLNKNALKQLDYSIRVLLIDHYLKAKVHDKIVITDKMVQDFYNEKKEIFSSLKNAEAVLFNQKERTEKNNFLEKIKDENPLEIDEVLFTEIVKKAS